MGHYLVITKEGHSYVFKFEEGGELSLLLALVRYAQCGDFNLEWKEVIYLVNELCRQSFRGRGELKFKRPGGMKYRVF